MKFDNEYAFQPTFGEMKTALLLQDSLSPSPKVEFIEQPAEGPYSWTEKVFRITNPNTGQSDDFGVRLTSMYPRIAIQDCIRRLGFVYADPPAAPTPVVLHPITRMKDPKPGQTMTPLGPSGD